MTRSSPAAPPRPRSASRSSPAPSPSRRSARTNAASSKTLNGTFKLTKGSYSNGKARGTWFRMSNSGG